MKSSFSIASCGSSQFSQNCLTEDQAIPCESAIALVESVRCGGWHSFVIQNNHNCLAWGCNSDNQINSLTSQSIPFYLDLRGDIMDIFPGTNFTIFFCNDKKYILCGPKTLEDAFNAEISPDMRVFAKFQTIVILKAQNSATILNSSGKQAIVPQIDGMIDTIEPTTDGCAILTSKGALLIYKGTEISAQFSGVISVAASRSKVIFLSNLGQIFEVFGTKTIQIHGVSGLPLKIFAGGAHFGCITLDGSAYTWGSGLRGQLGNGHYDAAIKPQKVILSKNKRIMDASAGEEHTIFLLAVDTQYSPMVPKAYRQTLVGNALMREAALPYALAPSEFDVKI